jgi:hypothetical protein
MGEVLSGEIKAVDARDRRLLALDKIQEQALMNKTESLDKYIKALTNESTSNTGSQQEEDPTERSHAKGKEKTLSNEHAESVRTSVLTGLETEAVAIKKRMKEIKADVKKDFASRSSDQREP